MLKKKFTNEQFIEAIKTSYSMCEVFRKIGIHPAGNSYCMFRKLAATLNLDYSHFTGQAHMKGKTHNRPPLNKRSLNEILVEKSDYVSSHNLRKRLIKEGVLKNECSICKITAWLGKALSLQLDHINGDREDQRIENLRILCPNCHSQTDTYCGKNIKKCKNH